VFQPVPYNLQPRAVGVAFSTSAALPPIVVPHGKLDESLTVAESPVLEQPHSVVQYGSHYHAALSTEVETFISKRRASLQSENDMLPRDHAMLDIVRLLAGDMELHHNIESASVTQGSRLDGWLARQNEPPLLLLEQKKRDDLLQQAQSDLTTKFLWLPHYRPEQHVFGIATAGNLVSIGRFTQAGALNPDPIGILDVSTLGGALACVQAMINIGRELRDCPRPASFDHRFGSCIVRPRAHVWIFARHITKTYFPLTAAQRTRMRQFYQASSDNNVPGLERVPRDPSGTIVAVEDASRQAITFELTPVGVSRAPHPGETQRWLGHVLQTLAACARLNWAIVDVRVPNVVLDMNQRWTVIDAADHATPFGQPLPALPVFLVPGLVGANADARTDVQQLAASVQQYGAMVQEIQRTRAGALFFQQLCSGAKTAAELSQLAYIRNAPG
jgi:hypothetical protein